MQCSRPTEDAARAVHHPVPCVAYTSQPARPACRPAGADRQILSAVCRMCMLRCAGPGLCSRTTPTRTDRSRSLCRLQSQHSRAQHSTLDWRRAGFSERAGAARPLTCSSFTLLVDRARRHRRAVGGSQPGLPGRTWSLRTSLCLLSPNNAPLSRPACLLCRCARMSKSA